MGELGGRVAWMGGREERANEVQQVEEAVRIGVRPCAVTKAKAKVAARPFVSRHREL